MTPPPEANAPTLDGRLLELFEPPCPSCGDTKRWSVARPRAHNHRITGRFTEVACGGCGLVYMCPRPIGSELGLCYGVLSSPDSAPPLPGRGLLAWIRDRWRQMNGQDVALGYVGDGPVLDAGCNRGELLLQLREAGLEVEGLEFNPVAVAQCRKLGFTVFEGDVTSTPLPEKKYRTIVLAHTLEHLTDPVGDLRILARSLAGEDSRIVIVVPHADSPARRKYCDSWHGWDPPFHICHFTAPTLADVAKRAGLRLYRHRVICTPEDYTRSKAIASGRSGRRLIQRFALLLPLKLLQAFGKGGVLLADLRLATAS